MSGNVSRGHTTPAGLYSLTYKQRDAVLKGEGYASPVKYWMPFNGGIGFHDASWRSSFGGSIYKTGGSHGCVNMPYAAAKELYENVYAGMPVICYNLPGTESKAPTKASGKPPAGGQATQPTKPAAPGGQTAQPNVPATQPNVPATQPNVQPTQPNVQPPAGGQEAQPGDQATQPGGQEAQPGGQPPQPEPTQASGTPGGPEITPVENGTTAAGGGGSGGGYGPAFGSAQSTEGGGPGVS